MRNEPIRYLDDLDCNRCNSKRDCKPKELQNSLTCKFFEKPREGFPLVELALSYPQNLHKALSALPFKVKLQDYFKKGEI